MSLRNRRPLPTLDPVGALSIYRRRLTRVVVIWVLAAVGIGIPLLAASAIVRAFDLSDGVAIVVALGLILAQLGTYVVVSSWRRIPARQWARR